MQKRLQIVIEGIVQGVGFRPFIYREAKSFGLKGYVLNTSDVVNIEVQGDESNLEAFISQIKIKSPPASKINKIYVKEIPLKDEYDFRIEDSLIKSPQRIYLPKDLSICKECLNELFNPDDRRYLYPFINCTNCGPRYSIIEKLPYDRKNTTMLDFPMCEECLKEYNDPITRRYHAEPNACEKCGPKVSLLDSQGFLIADSIKAIKLCKKFLEEGKIIAIKGIGGFHLATDAYNNVSVSLLRDRKRRGNEPLAVMMPDIDAVKKIAIVSSKEEEALLGVERPIVLLKKSKNYNLSEFIAPRLKRVGIMLPYTPLHYLLFKDLETDALVMTSANFHNEPIVSDNKEAFTKLKDVADYYLTNNRRIRRKIDDSVIFFLKDKKLIQRRSRGYVPEPIEVSFPLREGVAFGGELKNTIALSKNNLIYISQHIGDLKNKDSFEYMKWVYFDLLELLSIKPSFVASDLHPDYLSTLFAESLNLPLTKVQHHKAHIASVIGSLNIFEKEIIGISFDGTGFGEDGNSWGGEFFICRKNEYKRVAHFEYFELPGGDKATEEIWRIGYSLLKKSFGKETPLELPIDKVRIELINKMLEQKINSPLTSSVGRLFDGVSSLLNLTQYATFEGEGAMLLESFTLPGFDSSYDVEILKENDTYVVELSPLIKGIVEDIKKGLKTEEISSKFHNFICEAILKLVRILRNEYLINNIVISGGVFQNMYLLKRLQIILAKEGFSLYIPDNVPINDGGLSFGQIYLASLS